MKPAVSIIIVTYNSASCIEECLRSIPRSTGLPHETIVVDNASRDNTVELVREDFREVKLVALEANRGFSAANNVGAQLSEAPYLLLLNSDTVVLPQAIERMVDSLGSDLRHGVVGPRLVGSDGETQISFGRMIGFVSEAYQKLLGAAYERGLQPFVAYVRWRSRRPHRPDWVSGACLLVRRQVYEAVGGMDENFFMYTEEVDLCARIRQWGYAVVYEPAAEVLHIGGVSTHSNRRKTVLEYRRSQLYFYRKHHGPVALWLLKAYLRLKFGLSLAVARLAKGLGLKPAADAALLRELLHLVRGFRAA